MNRGWIATGATPRPRPQSATSTPECPSIGRVSGSSTVVGSERFTRCIGDDHETRSAGPRIRPAPRSASPRSRRGANAGACGRAPAPSGSATGSRGTTARRYFGLLGPNGAAETTTMKRLHRAGAARPRPSRGVSASPPAGDPGGSESLGRHRAGRPDGLRDLAVHASFIQLPIRVAPKRTLRLLDFVQRADRRTAEMPGRDAVRRNAPAAPRRRRRASRAHRNSRRLKGRRDSRARRDPAPPGHCSSATPSHFWDRHEPRATTSRPMRRPPGDRCGAVEVGREASIPTARSPETNRA